MAKFNKIRSMLRDILNRKRNNTPQSLGRAGHRGIAMGSKKKRDEMSDAFFSGESDIPVFTEEEYSKWETLPPEHVDHFVLHKAILYVHSTNVAAAQYDPESKAMRVQYLSGGIYEYDWVTQGEALGFAQAQSKGSWVDKHLKKANKRYKKVSGWFD